MDAFEIGDRIKLGHAALQCLADDAGVQLIHIKGYATLEGLYPTLRTSTDADILVRPSHMSRFLGALQDHRWEKVTSFFTGSAFHHAASYRHPWWGAVDVHRLFPGLQADPEEAFDALWARRQTAHIAHFPCTVLSYLDQVLFILLHSVRDGSRGIRDSAHLRKILSDQDLQRVSDRARELRAEVGLAAWNGTLEKYQNHSDYLLWKYMMEGGSRMDEWRARLAAARTPRDKAATLGQAFLVNTDHLAMKLGRSPTRGEIIREWFVRFGLGAREFIRSALHRASSGTRGGGGRAGS
ncbi:nucleotidyltransferase family protein [Curtobacterium sp. S6]|uniref:nucleotidyltransferase family protein n=1 Tax=Curtobacterium sp. S6 TaxID=1479623 RepID=UPI00068FF044|nr:nucleotidyltransferase family protein [Curtobacterium sp. S6]